MKVYKMSDRIKVKIEDITLHISPLNLEQKADIGNDLVDFQVTKDVRSYSKAIVKAVCFALKDIEGVEDSDGQFKLRFDENGNVDIEDVELLLNSDLSDKIGASCMAFINSIPKEIRGEDGKPLEGVEILNPLLQTPKKK